MRHPLDSAHLTAIAEHLPAIAEAVSSAPPGSAVDAASHAAIRTSSPCVRPGRRP